MFYKKAPCDAKAWEYVCVCVCVFMTVFTCVRLWSQTTAQHGANIFSHLSCDTRFDAAITDTVCVVLLLRLPLRPEHTRTHTHTHKHTAVYANDKGSKTEVLHKGRTLWIHSNKSRSADQNRISLFCFCSVPLRSALRSTSFKCSLNVGETRKTTRYVLQPWRLRSKVRLLKTHLHHICI